MKRAPIWTSCLDVVPSRTEKDYRPVTELIICPCVIVALSGGDSRRKRKAHSLQLPSYLSVWCFKVKPRSEETCTMMTVHALLCIVQEEQHADEIRKKNKWRSSNAAHGYRLARPTGQQQPDPRSGNNDETKRKLLLSLRKWISPCNISLWEGYMFLMQ